MFERVDDLPELIYKKGYAIETSPKSLNHLIKTAKYKIEPYLKRVKRENNKFLFLVSTNEYIENSITVEIPVFAPYTEHKEECDNKWPCVYKNRYFEPVNEELAFKMLRETFSYNLEICSCSCVIADGEKILYKALDRDNILGHSILDAVKEVSQMKKGYLCNNFTAYLYREPCISCAFALVHGRIKNVFCYKKSEFESYSKLKINLNKNFNHRYDVYFNKFN